MICPINVLLAAALQRLERNADTFMEALHLSLLNEETAAVTSNNALTVPTEHPLLDLDEECGQSLSLCVMMMERSNCLRRA